MDQFNALIRKQEDLRSRMSKTMDSYTNLASEKRTPLATEGRLATLESSWFQYQQHHELLIELQNESNEQHSYFQEDQFQACLEEFLAHKELLLTQLRDLREPPRAGSEPISRTSAITAALPKIPLPRFSGEYQDWIPFRNLFESMIHQNEDLSDVQRLHYLRTHVSGEAARLISNLPLTNASFLRAWAALENRYEHRRRIIEFHLDTLFKQQPLVKESAEQLKTMCTHISEALAALEGMSVPIEQWDLILVYHVSRLLDPATHRAWETSLGGSREPVKFAELIMFLENRIRTFEVIEARDLTRSTKSHPAHPPTSRPLRARVHVTESITNKCSWCNGPHHLCYCPKYRGASHQQRYKFALYNNLCINCLGHHSVRTCRNKTTCRICQQPHHSSLHDSEPHTSAPLGSTTSTEPKGTPLTPDATASTYHGRPTLPAAPRRVLLATARANLITNNAAPYSVRILIDQGSEISFIREAVIRTLKVPRQHCRIALLGIGCMHNATTRGVVTITLQSRLDPIFSLPIEAHVLPKLTGFTPTTGSTSLANWPHVQDLELADPDFNNPGHIDIVIGADYFGQLIRDGLRTGDPGTPIAQNTVLGWIISGPTGVKSAAYSTNSCTAICTDDHSLHELVERFWRMELPMQLQQPQLTSEERACEDHFRQTHSRDRTGRYIVRLPFRGSPVSLGNSYLAAERALRRIQRYSRRYPNYRKLYREFLDEYQRLDHMSEIHPSKLTESPAYFLPHHGVLRESSSTTRLRVVFNGSAMTDQQLSLNDCLLPGPKLQRDLADVILRWRRHPIVISADIEKMYRQIRIHKDDQCYQQILWAEYEHQSTRVYQLNTVTYGLTSAPYLAMRVLKQLVDDEGTAYPLAASIVERDMYVDDILTGTDTLEVARNTVQQLQQLFTAGGFHVHKWTSNTPDVLTDTTTDAKDSISLHHMDDSSIVRTLGLAWSINHDSFTFQVNQEKSPKIWTKRHVLSVIARIFDPLGWLAPWIVTAKILLQRMWTVPLQWDDPVPPLILRSWNAFHGELVELSDLSVPRWLGTYHHSRLEVHGFSDASQDAIAACVYLRVNPDASRPASCILLAAKTRDAPLKRQTIPRLELQAAVLLAQLMSRVISALELENVTTHAWTDSAVVLHWLRRPTHSWKDFVANRLTTITDKIPHATWHHVSSTENPADAASRGTSVRKLHSSSLWWHGPSWLTTSPDAWPSFPAIPPEGTNLEERTVRANVNITLISAQWELLNRYFRLSRLLRVTAYVIRAAAAFRKRALHRESSALTPHELNQAKLFWLLQTQQAAFEPIITSIKNGRPLSKSSPLQQFTPFLDHHGVLRVGGRLKNASLGLETIHPAIIPSDSTFSKLVIDDSHRRTLHGGVQSTLATIRQEYWLLSGRRAVKSHVLRCVICARHRAQGAQQLMGQLPRARVSPSRPFQHSGVDYAGPFILKTWRGRAARTYKSYLVVFVCFSTSAVHLEMATDYSTEGFLAAYRRFCGRRGACTTLTSDCGTNFVGADSELKRLYQSAGQEVKQIADSLTLVGTRWNFNPPGAPHFGGKWEAAVKSTKHHLRRVIGDTILTYEEITTTLAQIEGILNSRPLCPLSDDPTDLSALTPAHFLIGESITLFPEPSLLDIKTSRLSRWQLTRQLTEQFWRRWSAEYLQRLQGISKWHHPSNHFQIGALVLVIDERLLSTKWALARITHLHPGSDGLTRVATVRSTSSTFRRPISKLCILPIDASSAPSPPSLPLTAGGHNSNSA